MCTADLMHQAATAVAAVVAAPVKSGKTLPKTSIGLETEHCKHQLLPLFFCSVFDCVLGFVAYDCVKVGVLLFGKVQGAKSAVHVLRCSFDASKTRCRCYTIACSR